MKSDKLTPEQIQLQIECSFLPHNTYVEVFDYKYRIRFQIRHEEDNSVLCTISNLIIHNIDTPQTLAEVIIFAREQVETRLKSIPSTIPRHSRQYDPHGKLDDEN